MALVEHEEAVHLLEQQILNCVLALALNANIRLWSKGSEFEAMVLETSCSQSLKRSNAAMGH